MSRPYTLEEFIPNKDRWLRRKASGHMFRVVYFDPTYRYGQIKLGGEQRGYTLFELHEQFTFEDGSPVGIPTYEEQLSP